MADALGLGTISDGEPGMDPALLRKLYRHARGEEGQRALFTNDATFVRGWLNLDAPQARELIAAFVPLDDADTLKQARRNAQANLEAQAWNDILGIECPPILCKVKIHGARWGLRFQSAEPAVRGHERINEELPAAVVETSPPTVHQPEEPPATNTPEQSSTTVANAPSVLDVLKRAGMPT
ncbi:MAG: hypothetical protein FJ276_16505 [Planctomycetes bacterium]|nr:hypothetical protein [Planctomycetota bacterium]